MTKLALFATVLLGACSVGEVPAGGSIGPDGASGADAPGSATPDGGAALIKNACAMGLPPEAAHIHAGAPATARAGVACMAGTACHGTGGAGGGFDIAGSAYADTGGAAPMTGAIIRIISLDGKTLIAKTVTDSAGNFHIPAGTLTTFPYTTDITKCGTTPDEKLMQGQIPKSSGNCNNGTACHAMPGPQPISLAL